MAKRKTIDDLMNDITFQTIYTRLKNLALNMFEWDGLPEGMRPEFIERNLYTYGSAVFVNDRNLGNLVLKANMDGRYNVYGDPTHVWAWGHDYNKRFSLDDCVLIRNNPLMTNTHDTVMLYTNKLVEIERALDVNVKNQKFPILLTCDDKDLLTMKNIYAQVDGNRPVIFADKSLNTDAIQVFNTDAPFVADKLADYRHDVTNEILSILGINNSNTDKKERLITDEVNSNNDYIKLNTLYMLESRERACDEINKMFGLSVSVKLREVEQDAGDLHDDPSGAGGEPTGE